MTTPIYQFWWRSYEKQGQDFERKIEKMQFTSCRLWWPSFPCIFDVIVFALTFFKNILFFQHNEIRLSQKFHVIFRHNQLKFGQEPSQQSLFTVLQNFCIIYYICHYYICDWIKNLHKDDAFIQKKKNDFIEFWYRRAFDLPFSSKYSDFWNSFTTLSKIKNSERSVFNLSFPLKIRKLRICGLFLE